MPDAPWHSHRDRLAEVAAALAILAGTCGKIARDVTLLMQTEIAEAFEPAAPGRSMPHLRSPTAASAALACATMAPQLAATIMTAESHEHEGATGAWQVEWPAFPSLLLVVSGALAGVVAIGEGLEIDNERMRLNLDATRGLIMAESVLVALAGKLGKPVAHQVVEEAIQKAVAEKRHLQEVLGEDERVTLLMNPGEVARLFEPPTFQGVAQTFIERLVASAQARLPRR
jgi:3-carboxy-cis,cis-muconate cycloisomerase